MKLGVFTVLFSGKPFEQTLEYLSGLGVQAVEIGAGGYPGNAHCNPEVLLKDDKLCTQFLDTVKKYDLEISALSCHGNPVHPQKDIAGKFNHDFDVLIDPNPDCPPDEKYKAIIAKKAEKGSELYCMFSGDGVHFRDGYMISNKGWVNPFDSHNTLNWDPHRKKIRLLLSGCSGYGSCDCS
jgi:hypothetical protein